MPEKHCVAIRGLEHAWRPGAVVLAVPEFELRAGEKVFLQGSSGSGKSTLLGLIAGVFPVQKGDVQVLGKSMQTVNGAQRDRLRADEFGVIFQQFNLVPYLSLTENVLLPCQFSAARAARTGATKPAQRDAAVALLDRLGLGDEASDGRSVAALSVGQQQRVAAARALIGSPSIVIADEPTSALDTASRDAFIETLLTEAQDASVLFVSHDIGLAPRFDRSESMADLNTALPSHVEEV
ncbi:MAG: ATP-binding cassette domain-containing protein [Pseudomonadota bacterium]